MITLDEYKKRLTEYYYWPCDAGVEKEYQRSITLATYYKDELLQRIINDTYSFVSNLLNSTSIKDGYYYEELDEDISFYISLGLTGGHTSDIIYVDSNDQMISNYIMQEIFGEIKISVDEDITTYESESHEEYDIMSFSRTFSLRINSFPKNIDEIKDKFLNDKKVLVKK